MNEFGEPQFRIPKISVPIVCQMLSGERISGEVFVDDLGSRDYTLKQIIDFFNDSCPYFPIRSSSASTPILIQKAWVADIDIQGMFSRFEIGSTISLRKNATFYRSGMEPVKGTVVFDMPEDHSRLLDVLNLGHTFFPVLINDSFCLMNARNILKIEEA